MNTTASDQQLMTPRELKAAHFPKLSMHRLLYALSLYGIEPVRRVGHVRMYGSNQVAEIKMALKRIAERRGGM